MKSAAEPSWFWKSAVDPDLVQVTEEGGKLSTLQVRLRASPSSTLVLPVITGVLQSARDIHFTDSNHQVQLNKQLHNYAEAIDIFFLYLKYTRVQE